MKILKIENLQIYEKANEINLLNRVLFSLSNERGKLSKTKITC